MKFPRRAVILAACVIGVGVSAYYFWPSAQAKEIDAKKLADDQVLAQRRASRIAGGVDSRPASVGGRVVARKDGRGVAGAIISVTERSFDGGARGRPGASPEPLVVRSDSEGRWSLNKLPAGRYSVSATARGFAPALVDPVDLSPGDERRDIEFRLRQGGHRLSGIVTDIGGGPVSGALVRARSRKMGDLKSIIAAPFTTRTGDDGRYELALEDGKYGLEIRHLDYRRTRRQTEIRGGPRVEDFKLSPGGVIEGLVLRQSDDSTVEGAMVTLAQGGFTLTGITEGAIAVSDAEGRFMLRGLDDGALLLQAVGRGVSTRTSVRNSSLRSAATGEPSSAT